MCGIFLLYQKDPLTEDTISKLKKINSCLKHRGPDAEGFFISKDKKLLMGHNRLAIIDLDERANQPMIKENFVIIFNGEIYNFKSIRTLLTQKGSVFLTKSDTEVIIEAYRHFGKNCVNLFQGMFAFCIYDINSNEIFCARDRIGEKPLIYYSDKEKIIISSEIPPILKTLKDVFKEKLSIKEEILTLYFLANYQHIPEPFSIWDKIKKIKPGCYLIIRNSKIEEYDFYYQPQITEKYLEENEEKIAHLLREKLIKAVELTTVADVPIAILLSGGVDSSIIVYILKKILKKDIIAFTYGKDENDEEVKRASKIAEALNIPIKKFYFEEDAVLDSLKETIALYGEPLSLFQFAYSDILFKNIKKEGIKVVITGHGSDEIFFGYISHPKTLLFSYLIYPLIYFNFINNHWLKILKYKTNRLSKKNIFNEKIVLDLFKEFEPIISKFEKRLLIDFSNFWALINENAHSITMVGDLPGMKNSVEVRSPFLNHEVVELGFSINPRMKIKKLFDDSGIYNKWILKKAFDYPEIRKNLFLKKMGFGFNIRKYSQFNTPFDFKLWSIRVFCDNFDLDFQDIIKTCFNN